MGIRRLEELWRLHQSLLPLVRRLWMETWDAITARRNVREFADRVIPDADLAAPEAGRIAPASHHRQPWDFVVVTDREMLG